LPRKEQIVNSRVKGRHAVGAKRDANPAASLHRRLGKSAQELGASADQVECPDIWELDNGDIAVIGPDLTASYVDRLPDGVVIGSGERLVVIPRVTLLSAKPDIPDA
jgi:ethanolamine utilization microcompartment shell protein EutS